MQFRTQNGWTRERMKAEIMSQMLDHRSLNGDACLYRAPDGNRCAVGVFIPDELYHPEMDSVQSPAGTGAEQIIDCFGLMAHMPLDIEGMTRLQRKHDGAFGIDPRPHLLAWIDTYVIDAEEEV